MSALNVFTDLTAAGSRLGFYTLQNSREIPPVPGCYGWFLPLWLLHDTLPQFLNSFGNVLSHEPKSPADLDAGFTWDAVKVRVTRSFDPKLPAFAEPLWDDLNGDSDTKNALQRILLQASILTTPLYVGKTRDLNRRYTQHTTPLASGFNRRFSEFASRAELTLQVTDLIFVCISTGRETERVVTSGGKRDQINDLVEEILKRLCRPPFSRQ